MILSATSSRQVDSIVDGIKEELIKDKLKPLAIEGTGSSGWVLMDYGSLIVHVFTEEMRDYYSIERLYKDGLRLDLEGVG